MTDIDLPPIIDPDTLQGHLGRDDLVVVDLSKPEVHALYHIPGAVHLPYGRIIAIRKPLMGLLPDDATLGEVLGGLGITSDKWVVAYDEEGGGKAGRLLWTLAVLGHEKISLLDGGLLAWSNEGHPVSGRPVRPEPAVFAPRRNTRYLADADYILSHLRDPDMRLLDARSPAEYSGARKLAARGGHIPGAVLYEWTEAMQLDRNRRLRPAGEIRAALASRGITPDHEIVVYCQTHHRSSHTFMVLRHLGFERVKGYPGAWSEWGNRTDTPVEGGG
jgi:thiosulfate/3-mercaptopyruvate sulfurtransferase